MAVSGALRAGRGGFRAVRATERRRVGCGRPSTGSGRWWGVGCSGPARLRLQKPLTPLGFLRGSHAQRRSVGSTAPRSEAASSTVHPIASAMRGAQSSIISSIVVS